MGIKEDFQNYQQRQEAKRYFRSNNDAFLSPQKMISMFLTCMVVTALLQIAATYIYSIISVSFSIVYLLIAYIVVLIIRSYTTVARASTTILGIASYLIGLLLGKIIYYAFFSVFSSIFTITEILMVVTNLPIQSIIFLIGGSFMIYYYTK